MNTDRLAQQIGFVVEIDKLKSVLRQSILVSGERRENSAEHSWHVATMAILLAEHAEGPVDLGRVIKMLLIHDIVEVDAGDTYCYDDESVLRQADREQEAANRLFGMLPPDQAAELHDLRQEFDTRSTPEARFAAALDRLMPLLHNYHSQGKSWQEHDVARDQVLARCKPIRDGSRKLWGFAESVIEDAVTRGVLNHT